MATEILKNEIDYLIVCNHSMIDQFGMLSAIGIFDQINKKKGEDLPFNFYLVARLLLKSQKGPLKGKKLKIELFSLTKELMSSREVLLNEDLESNAYNINHRFSAMLLKEEGDYYIEISFEEDLLKKKNIFNVVSL